MGAAAVKLAVQQGRRRYHPGRDGNLLNGCVMPLIKQRSSHDRITAWCAYGLPSPQRGTTLPIAKFLGCIMPPSFTLIQTFFFVCFASSQENLNSKPAVVSLRRVENGVCSEFVVCHWAPNVSVLFCFLRCCSAAIWLVLFSGKI